MLSLVPFFSIWRSQDALNPSYFSPKRRTADWYTDGNAEDADGCRGVGVSDNHQQGSKKLQPGWGRAAFTSRLDSSRIRIHLVFSFAYRFIPVHLLNTSDRGQCVHNLTDAAVLLNKAPSPIKECAYLINLLIICDCCTSYTINSISNQSRQFDSVDRQTVGTTKRFCLTAFHQSCRSGSGQWLASGMTWSPQMIRFRKQRMEIKKWG